ncbi:WD repeat-containing protein 35, partial [Armadillidium nasatum]
AIPNNVNLRCVSWNRDEGYIACGGDDGLLKVLRLDPDGMMLKQHKTLMSKVAIAKRVPVGMFNYNEYSEFAYHDFILQISYFQGSWYEEMINNRNKSVVRGMAWNCEGQKICIVYEDGAVIVGSVDGNRIWGKELKGQHLTGVEWSPDSQLLLFSLASGEVHLYDNTGGFVCLGSLAAGANVVGLQWYNGKHGYLEPDCPALSICYDNGRMQIMRNQNDDQFGRRINYVSRMRDVDPFLKCISPTSFPNYSLLKISFYNFSIQILKLVSSFR